MGEVKETMIPVRFHLYWAGSDRDGTIAGFYYAVTETLATPSEFGVPPLPGPSPVSYRFTTKTDSIFVFTVSELFTDRQHAFYVYAVDNKGRVDPTPAKFIFRAIDKYPPRPYFRQAKAGGWIVPLNSDGSPGVRAWQEFAITDTLNPRTAIRDTVPAEPRLDFEWGGLVTLAGSSIMKYRYKLLETDFQTVDSSVHSVSYGAGVAGSATVPPGTKVFTLRALDQAEGAGETTRRFYVNFAPTTWWAGPDLASFPVSTDGEYMSRSVDVTHWPSELEPWLTTNPPMPVGSTFGNDSLLVRPSRRRPPGNNLLAPGTFYEIWNGRLYARAEGDTVHQNSFVVLWNGGYDKDSRYVPRVDTTESVIRGPGGLRPGDMIRSAEAVGSPIGFRSIIVSKLTPVGVKVVPAQSNLYPIWEPLSVFRSPRIGGYWRVTQAGKSYALARAEDADGTLDRTVNDPQTLADLVDGGGGTPREQELRRKVLVFYVDKAPAIIRSQTGPFFPSLPDSTISTYDWAPFRLSGMDLDPYNPLASTPVIGGPATSTPMRFKVTLHQWKPSDGTLVSWTYRDVSNSPYIMQGTSVTLPSFIPGGTMANNPFETGYVYISVQVCDCYNCEGVPGQGRCVEGFDPLTGQWNEANIIRVYYNRPATQPALGTASSMEGRPGPDSQGRRDTR